MGFTDYSGTDQAKTVLLTNIKGDLQELFTDVSALGAAEGKAYVSADDTTAGYLNGKLVAGASITLTEGSGGANETLTIAFAKPTTGDLVGTSDTQTLSGKTLANRTNVLGPFAHTVYTIVDGVNASISANNGGIQVWTLGANRTPNANIAAGQTVRLMVDDGSGYEITWTHENWGGSGVVWVTGGGTAPTLAATGYTVIDLWTVGTQTYGAKISG